MVFLPRVKRDRTYERLHVEGSPHFEITIDNLAAGKKKTYGFESSREQRRYLPMNYIRIHNKANVKLKIYINGQTEGEPIHNDTYYVKQGEPIWSFTLENKDASDTATGSLIDCTVRRLPDSEVS